MKQLTARVSLAIVISIGIFGCGRQTVGSKDSGKGTIVADKSKKSPGPARGPTRSAIKEAASDADEEPKLNPRVLFEIPQFSLTDQANRDYGTSDLEGRVWIANFMFTNCVSTCPRQTARLVELQQRVSRWPNWNQVRFVSITVDPARDTPEQLTQYATRYAADFSHWSFLTGARDDLVRISKEGFKFPVAESNSDPANPITHSSRFVLVDSKRRARGVYESLLDDDIAKLVGDLQLVLSEPVSNPREPLNIGVPGDIFDPPWLAARKSEQLGTASSIEAFHDFQFSHRDEASGITFVGRPVADAAKDFKSNHYDHANGITVADVDGDGRLDLYFTAQVGGNELWRNVGEGRFENITVTAGVGLMGRVSVAASFADTDNDGDADLFVTTTRHGNVLFINDGKGHFEDRTDAAKLKYSGHSSSADFFDYDRDGKLDLLLTNVGIFTTNDVGYNGDASKNEFPYYIGSTNSFAGHLIETQRERSVLYHNEGDNVFRDVSPEMGFLHSQWSGDATPIDANEDGWIDLYVLNMQGNDTYYENIEGKRFERRSQERFPRAVWGGMGVKSFDYNNDGHMDLLITNMHADMWELQKNIIGADERRKVGDDVMPESYLRSREPGRNVLGSALYDHGKEHVFRDVSDEAGTDNYWPWGPSVGDLNADGYQDLFITSCMNYPFRYHVNSVLLNESGKRFRDAEFILGIEPRPQGKTAVPWFELDCASADSKHKLSKDRGGKVTVWGAVGSRSAAIFDLDGDGDLDIVTNDFNSRPMVLISGLRESKPDVHFLSIELTGTKSNRDALGATVEVRVGDKLQKQVLDGQSGYLSQSRMPLYFGLGANGTVDQVIVNWPNGTVQTVPGPIEGNQMIRIEEKAE